MSGCLDDAAVIEAALNEALVYFDRPYGHRGLDDRLWDALAALKRITMELAMAHAGVGQPGADLSELPLFEEAML